MKISLELLTHIYPEGPKNLRAFIDPINYIFDRYKINTPKRQAAFFGQVAVESLQLTRLRENTNYMHHPEHETPRLVQLWPRLFTTAEALRYEGKPERIASRIYANKYGNGDEASGDGWLYRGGGALMLTFKDQYKLCGDAIGVDLVKQPELIAQPRYAIESAGWYWDYRKLNDWADNGNLALLTERINTAKLDLNKRVAFTDKAMKVLA